ncbi:MAG TPA: protein translocase subunit SecD [Candidatus Paceibacterota bacterium]
MSGLKIRLLAVFILIVGLGLGYVTFFAGQVVDAKFPFKLGLDLSGGTHLIYKADVSLVASGEVGDAMDALRDVIERRVNLFGVTEPIVQVEQVSSVLSGGKEERLIVELPGVTDVDKAISMIGQTPLLEFKLERPDSPERQELMRKIEGALDAEARGEMPADFALDTDVFFEPTDLTGRYLQKATLSFDSISGESRVVIDFTKEGKEIFSQITRENVNRTLAIFLDGSPVSLPTIREEITGGSAEITGNFTPEEAKLLVGRLNSGALPVPIQLLSSQTIGPTLGAETLGAGVKAGLFGLLAVMVFMIFWYRVPGVVASLALVIYALANLVIFKLVGVTLTAAGIAGFILSLGMAVDGNILIFERMKEELRSGKKLHEAIHDGFARAWDAIWDGNVTAIISAAILFWFGTSLVEGFALTFGLGVILSMISSITVSRLFLYAIAPKETGEGRGFFFKSGISK